MVPAVSAADNAKVWSRRQWLRRSFKALSVFELLLCTDRRGSGNGGFMDTVRDGELMSEEEVNED